MPYRILVADPGPSVQKAVQMAFPEPEFRLCPVEDGARLIDEAAAFRPDTILLALSLPGIDAYAAARSLARTEALRNVPLFLLKGTFELVDRDKAEGVPLEGIVQKPFDSEKLAATVRDAIDRKVTPQSMPEDLPPEEPAPAGPSLKGPLAGTPRSGALRAQVREIVREEILEMERELEKRLRARIQAGPGKEP
jgi:CheY-like chemotaxis protein